MINTGNPTLDKNLECIEKYNPKLAQVIANLPYLTNNIQLIETNLKEPNLTFNGKPLHSQNGAEMEAQNVFAQTKNSPLSMHIIFGIGLGHLFKEFCTRSKGVVLLFEPNLEILRVTLELVDFTKELSQKNVLVVSDIQSFKEAFRIKYMYNAQTTFTYLGAYKDIYADKMTDFLKQIEMIIGGCIAEYTTLKQQADRSISMVLENLPFTLEEIPLFEFKDIYKRKTALIVSAGPSLDLNIETIKKNRDKVVIFCVGTAFKALMSKGITPDFVNMIEINDCSSQVKGFDLSNINFILEPYTNTSIHALKTAKKILFPTVSSHANDYWAKLTGIDISKYVAKGTVSYAALFSAKVMGCSKMILVGQDLAYVNNKCYSDGAAYSQLAYEINPETNKPEFKIKDHDKYIESLLPEENVLPKDVYEGFSDYKIKNLTDTLYYVKGINGEMLPTQGGYATFIEHFNEFARFNPDLDLINSSMIGAQIDRFKNIPLAEALEGESVVEKVEIKSSFEYDQGLISQNLETERQKLKDILKEFVKAKEYIFKFDREFARRKTVTTEANKFFRNLLGLYDKITYDHYRKNPVYQAVAFSEHIALEYFIKKTEKVDSEKIKEIYVLVKEYFSKIEEKLLPVIEKIKIQKGILDESINSKG